jgi:hypothetical protein
MLAKSGSSTIKVLAVSAVLATGLSACATQKPTASGFLTPPTRLAEPQKTYRAVMIEPVAYRPSGRIPARPSDADIAMLQSAYRAALTEAFAERLPLVQAAGPDMLRVKAAITGYSLANPAWNTAALVVPIGTRNGGVATEAEIVDSMTGVPVAQQSLAFNAGFFNSRPDAMFRRAAHAKAGFQVHARALAAKVAKPGTAG